MNSSTLEMIQGHNGGWTGRSLWGNHIFHKNDAPNCVARSVIEPHSEASANPKRVPGAS